MASRGSSATRTGRKTGRVKYPRMENARFPAKEERNNPAAVVVTGRTRQHETHVWQSCEKRPQ